MYVMLCGNSPQKTRMTLHVTTIRQYVYFKTDFQSITGFRLQQGRWRKSQCRLLISVYHQRHNVTKWNLLHLYVDLWLWCRTNSQVSPKEYTASLTLLQLGTFRPSVCVATFRFHLDLNKVHLKKIYILLLLWQCKKNLIQKWQSELTCVCSAGCILWKEDKTKKQNTYRCQAHAHVPWAYMCGMNKVCWLANHGAIDPPSPFLKTTTKTTI